MLSILISAAFIGAALIRGEALISMWIPKMQRLFEARGLLEEIRYIPRESLVTIYKSFIKLHLDNANVILDKPSNATFSNGIKSAKENAALQITRTIRGTSKEKLYQKLRFETMKERRWFSKLVVSIKL